MAFCSDEDNDQGGQPESSEKANLNSRSYPKVGGTSDTKVLPAILFFLLPPSLTDNVSFN